MNNGDETEKKAIESTSYSDLALQTAGTTCPPGWVGSSGGSEELRSDWPPHLMMNICGGDAGQSVCLDPWIDDDDDDYDDDGRDGDLREIYGRNDYGRGGDDDDDGGGRGGDDDDNDDETQEQPGDSSQLRWCHAWLETPSMTRFNN